MVGGRAMIAVVVIAILCAAVTCEAKKGRKVDMHPDMPLSSHLNLAHPQHRARIDDMVKAAFSRNTPPRLTVANADGSNIESSGKIGLLENPMIGDPFSPNADIAASQAAFEAAGGPAATAVGAHVDLLSTESEADWSTDKLASEQASGAEHIEVKNAAIRSDFQPEHHAITIATQADLGRVDMVQDLVSTWQGPVSCAVLATKADEDKVSEKIMAMRASNSVLAKYVTFHVAIADKKWERYPINLMRNIAQSGVSSEYAFIIDADERVGADEKTFRKIVQEAKPLSPAGSKAFVVRSFQWDQGHQAIPNSFSQLRDYMDKGQVKPKHDYFPPAYGIQEVKPSEWVAKNTPVTLKPKEFFEPYFIMKTDDLKPFDTRFVGWGGNKNTLCAKMTLEGVSFVLLPRLFTFADETIPETTQVSQTKQVNNDNNNLMDKVMLRLASSHGCSNCEHIEKMHLGECYKSCPRLQAATTALQHDASDVGLMSNGQLFVALPPPMPRAASRRSRSSLALAQQQDVGNEGENVEDSSSKEDKDLKLTQQLAGESDGVPSVEEPTQGQLLGGVDEVAGEGDAPSAPESASLGGEPSSPATEKALVAAQKQPEQQRGASDEDQTGGVEADTPIPATTGGVSPGALNAPADDKATVKADAELTVSSTGDVHDAASADEGKREAQDSEAMAAPAANNEGAGAAGDETVVSEQPEGHSNVVGDEAQEGSDKERELPGRKARALNAIQGGGVAEQALRPSLHGELMVLPGGRNLALPITVADGVEAGVVDNEITRYYSKQPEMGFRPPPPSSVDRFAGKAKPRFLPDSQGHPVSSPPAVSKVQHGHQGLYGRVNGRLRTAEENQRDRRAAGVPMRA